MGKTVLHRFMKINSLDIFKGFYVSFPMNATRFQKLFNGILYSLFVGLLHLQMKVNHIFQDTG